MEHTMLSTMTNAISATSKLVLKLERRDNGKIHVVTCEVIGPDFSNRTRFNGNNEIHSVLAPKLADTICKHLERVSERHEVLSLPELVVELPGLSLSSVHIVVAQKQGGAQNIIFRFGNFVGGFNRALRNPLTFENSVADNNDRIATEVLSDIALPFLNLCRHPDIDGLPVQERVAKVHKRMAEKADEIEFYIELVKRFVRDEIAAGGKTTALPGTQPECIKLTHQK